MFRYLLNLSLKKISFSFSFIVMNKSALNIQNLMFLKMEVRLRTHPVQVNCYWQNYFVMIIADSASSDFHRWLRGGSICTSDCRDCKVIFTYAGRCSLSFILWPRCSFPSCIFLCTRLGSIYLYWLVAFSWAQLLLVETVIENVVFVVKSLVFLVEVVFGSGGTSRWGLHF